jgi:hypothetical protein
MIEDTKYRSASCWHRKRMHYQNEVPNEEEVQTGATKMRTWESAGFQKQQLRDPNELSKRTESPVLPAIRTATIDTSKQRHAD